MAAGARGSNGNLYKNGYVDSKGNKVVNGKWVSPAKQGKPSAKKPAPKPAAKKPSVAESNRIKANRERAKQDLAQQKQAEKNQSNQNKQNEKTEQAKNPIIIKNKAEAEFNQLQHQQQEQQQANENKENAAREDFLNPNEPPKPKPAKPYTDQIYDRQLEQINNGEARWMEDLKQTGDARTREHGLDLANVGLNKTNSLQNSAEDYASRGMMRSGVYARNMQESQKVFDDQTARMGQNEVDASAADSRAKRDYLAGSQNRRDEETRKLGERKAITDAAAAAATGTGPAIKPAAKKTPTPAQNRAQAEKDQVAAQKGQDQQAKNEAAEMAARHNALKPQTKPPVSRK